MKLKELKKTARVKHSINLEKTCVNLGYKNSLQYLQQVPSVRLLGPTSTRKCVVCWQSEVSRRSGMVLSLPTSSTPWRDQPKGSQQPKSTLGTAFMADKIVKLIHHYLHHSSGKELKYLKAFLWEQHRLNLERVSQDLGYRDAVSFLFVAPNIRLFSPAKGDECLVVIRRGANEKFRIVYPRLYSPSLFRALDQPGSEPHDLSAPSYNTVLRMVNRIFSYGLKVQKLKKALWMEHGVDLEKVSQNLGYKDVLSFLQEAPKIQISALAEASKRAVRMKNEVSKRSEVLFLLPISPLALNDQPKESKHPIFTPRIATTVRWHEILGLFKH
uniref:Uncharacterized protein LOC117368671 n=1 Tax=Geotrypetes seraphini TaxID=260995 RepID=A0A6P8SUL9_GEOSA|nr:uncharacterized protein LOC117368671 [Geotrypetes seraphini]